MSLDEALSHLTVDRDSAITIGVFDGVHRGHRHLISQLVEHALSSGSRACVVTFENHPITVLKPETRVDFLIDLDERTRLMRQLGVDIVVPIKFDRQIAQLSSHDFLQVLYEKLRMRHLVVGPDFAMGHNRDGSLETLPGIARHIGFSFNVVDLMTDPAGRVKSTTIRRQIADGDVSSAARLLGRNFAVRGVVVRGQERGRELGFPTANVEVAPDLVIPGNGIYATRARLDSGTYMAATSIGVRPTFDDGPERTIEAYLLNFSDDIYGQTVCLEFVQRLRGEEKFDTVEALLDQMNRDVVQTKDVLTRSAVQTVQN